jgi:hypothetical protein
LLGTPRIIHSHLLGDADAQKAFVADAIGALAKCLPADITDGLGGAVVGGAVTNPPAEGRAAYVERYYGPILPNTNVPSNSPYALVPQGQ